jgi:hypothetical protein
LAENIFFFHWPVKLNLVMEISRIFWAIFGRFGHTVLNVKSRSLKLYRSLQTTLNHISFIFCQQISTSIHRKMKYWMLRLFFIWMKCFGEYKLSCLINSAEASSWLYLITFSFFQLLTNKKVSYYLCLSSCRYVLFFDSKTFAFMITNMLLTEFCNSY